MARINLLPWRAERRKQRQKEFGIMLGASAVGALVLAMGINMYYGAQIDGQGERNAFVEQQIAEVEKQNAEIAELNKTKSRLLARKEVIEKLQASRSQMVHLFDSLVRTIPDGVVLVSIKQDDQQLTLEGRSQSNARVSAYMRSLEGSGWMTDPQLSIIEAKGEDKGLPYEFRLLVKLANPNAPRDTDGDGVPDAVPAPGLSTDVAAVAGAPTPAAMPPAAATPATSAPTAPTAPAANAPAGSNPAAPVPAAATPPASGAGEASEQPAKTSGGAS